ncbi:hypothetical protein B0H11DRAFT_2079513 [Mycena galericulata]|nr:hypothetical protein B0H11DRAFT_2079513 [Mycena galericulata]
MSDSNPSAGKRRRTDSELEDSGSSPVVRSTIWMPYGDIILQAESTQFRVNRDNLALQSSVFADMFAVPQPPNEPTIEGCPIVQVSDSAKDWELLLGVLYDPFSPKRKQSIPVLAAMLRLGRKYDIRKAKDDALERIHSEFPNDFKEWDSKPSEFVYIDNEPGILIDLLNLCYECGIYSSIPSLAFACLYSHTLELPLTGIKRADGTRASLSSDAVKVTLAIAFQRIISFQRENLVWLDGETVIPDASCRSQTNCKQQKIALSHSVAWNGNGLADLGYTIDAWDEEWSEKLCDSCEAAAKECYEASRLKGWQSLPSFFGLPEWNDLKDLD